MKEERTKHPWLLAGALLLVCLLSLSGRCAGTEEERIPCLATGQTRCLIPVGRTVGIKLFAHGVMVVGVSEGAQGEQPPARLCGLKQGDIITCINGKTVNSIEEVEQALACTGGTLDISATRDGRELELSLEDVPCDAQGACKLGAWVRDSMAGIGTVTFYDPESGTFAALGHGINDVDTGLLMPLRAGSVMPSSVSGVVKGQRGTPGELHGSFELDRDVGVLCANTAWGIFGTGEADYFTGKAVEVAAREELKTGAATILANVEGESVGEYQVEILRVYPAGGRERQSLLLRVTDPKLLEETGGIVQGMSGSPILQNGKLVGAVTHVLVNDPTRGYGICIEDMLDAAG